MTEEEKASILSAPMLLDFVEQTSKMHLRALNDEYDYLRRYDDDGETGLCVELFQRLN
jgi:dynein intermediate chain, cytosolic